MSSDWRDVYKPMGNLLGSGRFDRTAPATLRAPPPPPPAPVAPVIEMPKPGAQEPKPAAAAKPAPVVRVNGIQPQKHTIRGVILRAACELAKGSAATRISVSDLIVRAWELDSRLALRGYEDKHPDANRVQAKLCGPDGLIGLGLLARCGEGEVGVTRKGFIWWKAVNP
jgi:hypothetical protein